MVGDIVAKFGRQQFWLDENKVLIHGYGFEP